MALYRRFTGPGRVHYYYPPKVRFVAVVLRNQEGQGYFRFKLHLMPELSVTVWTESINRYNRLMGWISQKGWHFTIKGDYNPQDAMEAYQTYQADQAIRKARLVKNRLGLVGAMNTYLEEL